MSTQRDAEIAEIRPKISLEQLRQDILADTTLGAVKQRELGSALLCFGKAMRLPLDGIPADAEHLRAAIKGFTPAMGGFTASRWRNIRGLLQAAMARGGRAKVPGRYRIKPSPVWVRLMAGLQVPADTYLIGRFARYCTSIGIAPDEVDDGVLTRFLVDLTTQSLVADPPRAHRDTILCWNRRRAADPAWPQSPLAVPDNRKTYALPWDSFLPSLTADIAAWLERLAGQDPFAEHGFRPLKAVSLGACKREMHEIVSALVLRGQPAADLRTLADVVTPDRVAEVLRFFWERAGGNPSVHAGHIAGRMASVAEHWVGIDPASLKRIKGLGRRVRPEGTGLTARNRERLRPFDDERHLLDLLNLPQRIRAEVVAAGRPTQALARRLQTALMIELLLMVPVRIKNLAELQMATNLPRGRHGGMTLTIPDQKVKNRLAVEADLPREVIALIDLYLQKYRPLLGEPNSPWLFPGKTTGKPKSCDGAREQIQSCIADRCGLQIHPHLFRHLCAKIILDKNPGAHTAVQRTLGHKNLSTTMDFYSGLESKAALEHYDRAILQRRGDQTEPAARGRRRRAA